MPTAMKVGTDVATVGAGVPPAPAAGGTPARHDGKRGFALVITVILLAALILVLVAFATLTRIETSVAGNTRKFSLARQNALLGLEVALGRLQETAGPDQRATATADILSTTDPTKARWTGVWNSTDTSAPVWLASGAGAGVDSAAPAIGDLPADGVELVGANSTDTAVAGNRVVVAREPVGETANPLGHLAYWVGDEGVKARVDLVDPYQGTTLQEELHMRVTSGQRAAIEKVKRGGPASSSLGTDYPANNAGLARVLSLAQLPFVLPTSASDLTAANKARFHDFTVDSVGLLTDTRAGGLRRDLAGLLGGSSPSDATVLATIDGPAGAPNPTWGSLRAYYNLRNPTTGAIPPSASSGASQGMHPIVIALALWVGVAPQAGNLYATFTPILLVANPHDVAIAAESYSLRIHDGGTVTYAGLITPTIPGLISPLGGPGPVDFLLPLNETFLAGEVRLYSLSPGAVLAGGATQYPLVVGYTFSNAGFIVGRQLTTGLPTTAVEFYFDIGQSNFEFRLGSDILSEFNGITFETDGVGSRAIVTPAEFALPFPRGIGRLVHLRLGNPPVAGGGEDGSGFATRAYAQHSIRARTSARFSPDDPWRQNPVWDVKRLARPVNQATVVPFEPTVASWGSSFNRPRTMLFHVLRNDVFTIDGVTYRTEPISLGQFQHASFAAATANGFRLPTYAIGNSDASPYVAPGSRDPAYAVNEALWDSAFLPGFRASAILDSNGNGRFDAFDIPQRLPNRRMVRHAPPSSDAVSLTADNLAGALTIAGPFNANSTSIEAWVSVLGALTGTEDPATRTVYGANPFLRSPYPIEDAGSSDLGTAAPASLSARGVRQFDDTQLRALATALVAEIRARGPARTLGQFVNRKLGSAGDSHVLKGRIQAALDATTNLQPSWPSVSTVPSSGLAFPEAGLGPVGANFPGWISQADVLTALGPILTARSDTFRIRAYGEATNPVTQRIEGRAWCEAIVQRTYEDAGGALGRRFQIVAFRWLTPADI